MFKRSPRKPRFRKGRADVGIATWWTIWRVPILLAVVSAGWWFLYRPYIEEQGWQQVPFNFAQCGESWAGAQGCVVDGDTVIIGSGNARRRIRLTGFDAPEIDGACAAESARALEAKSALYQWLTRGPFEWTDDENMSRDQYGRELREVSRPTSDGPREYLARHMIGRNLASESGWGAGATDWCG